MNRQKGISKLAATMVVVVLLIVVVLTVLLYRSHLIRIRIEQALSATDAAKVAVMEAAMTQGSLGRMKASEFSALAAPPTSEYVKSISIGDSGVITLMTRGTGVSPDPVLQWMPQEDKAHPGQITWQCRLVTKSADEIPGDCQTSPSTAHDAVKPSAPTSSSTR